MPANEEENTKDDLTVNMLQIKRINSKNINLKINLPSIMDSCSIIIWFYK